MTWFLLVKLTTYYYSSLPLHFLFHIFQKKYLFLTWETGAPDLLLCFIHHAVFVPIFHLKIFAFKLGWNLWTSTRSHNSLIFFQTFVSFSACKCIKPVSRKTQHKSTFCINTRMLVYLYIWKKVKLTHHHIIATIPPAQNIRLSVTLSWSRDGKKRPKSMIANILDNTHNHHHHFHKDTKDCGMRWGKICMCSKERRR